MDASTPLHDGGVRTVVQEWAAVQETFCRGKLQVVGTSYTASIDTTTQHET